MKEVTIRDVLKLILKDIWVISMIPLGAVVAATIFAYFVMDPIYTASTTFYVLNRQESEKTVTSSDLSLSLQLVADYRELALSKRVIDTVARQLNLNPDTLRGAYNLQVSAANNTRVIQISASAKDPVLAANLANAVVREFSVSVIEIMDADNVNIVDVAVPPKAPSAPKKSQLVLVAAAAALLAAIAIVVLKEMLNTTIRTSEDVENNLGLTVLAKIPSFGARP